MSSVSPWDTATTSGNANDFVTGGNDYRQPSPTEAPNIKAYAPISDDGKQPIHWIADENGQLVAVYADDDSADSYVPNTSHLPEPVEEKKQWHDGKKTHFVSIASALLGAAAVTGIVPTVTPAQGMEMLGNSTLLSGSRFLLVPILKTLGGIFGRR